MTPGLDPLTRRDLLRAGAGAALAAYGLAGSVWTADTDRGLGIAAQNAMIRVRDMSVRPEQNQTKLGGTLVFVGNFQQRPATNPPPRKVAAE